MAILPATSLIGMSKGKWWLSIYYHSLVSQTDSTTLEHGIGKFLVTGKMEISEYKLVLMDKWIFLSDRLFHLYYHIFRLTIYTLNVG